MMRIFRGIDLVATIEAMKGLVLRALGTESSSSLRLSSVLTIGVNAHCRLWPSIQKLWWFVCFFREICCVVC